MPFYRMNGMTIHVRGTKLPPACCAAVGIQTSDGQAMQVCGAISGFECDWPVANRRTCDKPLCEAHASAVGPNKHYCQQHHAEHLADTNQPGLFTSLVQS